MHPPSATAILFGLAASTLANPIAQCKGNGASVNAALQAKVQGTINSWLGDINTVNNFVDTVGGLQDPAQISQLAATAFKSAQDEGASNTALQKDVQLDAQGLDAAKALLGQFNIIGPAINDTIFNPGNVKKNLAAINGAR